MCFKKIGIVHYLKGHFWTHCSRFAVLLFLLAYGLWPMGPGLYAQTELGSEDDLVVLGTNGTALDPDTEIKGFTVFGSTQAAYPGAVVGAGNVVVNGFLSVSSGAYFVGGSTFSTGGAYFTGVSSFSDVANIHIAGGNVNQVLKKVVGGGMLWDNDGLGTHVATTTLNMTTWNIINISSVNFRSNVFISSAPAAQYGGIYISTHIYLPTGAKYYGDGSALSGVTGDNLGSHIATTTLNMNTFNIISVGSITANAAITTYSSITVAGNIAVSSVIASGNITAARYQVAGSTVLAILPGSGSIGVGLGAGMVDIGLYNSFFGYQAGYSNTGNYNSFLGYKAGNANTTGAANTFVGVGTGLYNETGEYNSFLGYQAGSANTTGGYNSFVGVYAGDSNLTGENNTFIGGGAGESNTTGSNNSAFGTWAGRYTVSGSANAIFGEDAGRGVTGNSFSSSTLMGFQAGYRLTTGSDNTLLGWRAGDSIDSGAGNIVVGYNQDISAPTSSNELNIGGVLYGNLSAKTIGISTRIPQAALDIVSTGTASNIYSQIWRNGSGNIVSSVTSIGWFNAAGINVPAINATATTPYGGVSITTNVFVTGGATIAKYTVQSEDSGITLTISDFGKTITVNSASAQIVYLPSVTAADIGATITVVKLGAGKVTIDAAASTYISDSTSGGTIYNNAVSPAYATITLRLVTATQWMIIGGEGSWIAT